MINTGNGRSKQKKRDFHRGDYIHMRKYLQDKKWNKLLENKKTEECWDIVKKELEFMINKFVPVKSQKRTRKKHLSKDALNQIINKRKLWKVFKCTGNDEDYIIYKEALEETTQEIRKSKLDFEHQLKGSKSFFAYIRSKQKVKDRVGSLKDIDVNVITKCRHR